MEPSKPLFNLPNPPQKPPHDWFSLWHVAGYLLLFAAFGAVFWFMYNIEQRRTAINTDFPVHTPARTVPGGWINSVNGSIVYVNSEYNFQLTFPTKWKGINVRKGRPERTPEVLDLYEFGIPDPENKSGISENGFAYAYTIFVETKSSFEDTSEFFYDTSLAKTDKYVFSYLDWGQDPPPGFSPTELETYLISNSFKLLQ